MKKIIAILLATLLLTLPVIAGWEEEANFQKVAYTFQKYAEKPVIDGVLDEFGYAKIDVQPGDLSYAYNDATAGADAAAKGLDFQAYASYDADYLYLYISMDTKWYYNDLDNGDGNIWGQSAIQVNIANPGDEGETRLEYGLGRNSVDGQQQFYTWAQHSEAAQEINLAAGSDFVVALDGSRLNYEVRTPVETFRTKKLAEGEKITICLVMAQCDKAEGEGGTGGYIHTQIASGCTGAGKHADYFATISLGGEMPGRPAPVEEEQPAVGGGSEAPEQPVVTPTPTPAPAATAPRTGDTGMIALLAVVIVAAAGVVIFRKKAVK
jgi:hypothetical protein